MAQFPQGLGLDLADAFPCHLKILTDFLEGMVRRFTDPKPFTEHLLLARRQGFQRAVDLALEIVTDGRLQR